MIRKVLLSGMVLVLCSCSARVIKYINPNAGYASYETYALVSLKGKNISSSKDPNDPLKRMERYISDEMTRRDYKRDLQAPDLILRYEIISSSKTESRNNNSFYFTTISTRTIIESTILVEMTDAKTKKLVWQASLDMREHSKITKSKDPLKEAIRNIYNTYLYRSGNRNPDPDLYMK
jgi:hypothetical protein